MSTTVFRIPKITDERLTELAERIKPAGRRVNGGPLFYIRPGHLRNEAFLWSPYWLGKVTKVAKLATVRTLHTYGAPSLFKPSVAECIAQIEADLSPEMLAQAVAFEVQGPADAKALNDERAALNAGFHVATTIVYGRAA